MLHPIAKKMWDQLKFAFGGALTTGLRNLVLKFKKYRKDSNHMMTKHLGSMSSMIYNLMTAGNVLIGKRTTI